MTERNSQTDSPESPQSADWEALARHIAGESTPEELARFEAVLAERPVDRELISALRNVSSGLAEDVPRDLDVESALLKVKSSSDFNQRPALKVESGRTHRGGGTGRTVKWMVPMPALAAAAALAIGLAGWFSINKPNREEAVMPSARMLATGVGVRDSLTLPDGSRIVLGPLSSVTVAAGYGEAGREVTVRGDAWFDVVHDTAKPFTVNAGSATIVDVGTTFAIRSDAPEGVSVTVTEGSVSLRQVNTSVEQSVILKAGDNGLLKSGGEVVTRRGTARDEDVAWLQGRLVFREASLTEVASSMRRWYGIELKITDQSLADRHLTATFAGESPDRVLDVLRLVLGADIERRGDTAIVRRAKASTRSR